MKFAKLEILAGLEFQKGFKKADAQRHISWGKDYWLRNEKTVKQSDDF